MACEDFSTLTDEQLLAVYKQAEAAIVSGHAASYSIGGRAWTALSLPDLQTRIRELELRIRRKSKGMFDKGAFVHD